MTLGVVLFIVTLVLLRDHRVLQRFTYTAGLLGIALLLLPFLPLIGARSTAPGSGSTSPASASSRARSPR